jgi:ABC-type Zn uptake system ZnuABC Zn-binding protein ZnuA
MKKINSNQLLENLQADVRELLLAATQLQQTANAKLSQAPAPGKMECCTGAGAFEYLQQALYYRH